MEPFKSLYFEISGTCNAKCPWCERGARNIGLLPKVYFPNPYISADKFYDTLLKLRKNNILHEDCCVNIYNWGEPALQDIVRIIKEFNYRVGISTNASHLMEFHGNDAMSHCHYFSISYPGFSQASYDKAHGFDFEKIKKNTWAIVRNLRASGMRKIPQIYMHIYNMHEMADCIKFCNALGIKYARTIAYFNSFEQISQYINNAMPYETLLKAKNALFLFPYENLHMYRPAGYVCPQYKILTLSHNGKLSSCCGCTLSDSAYGNSYEIADIDGLTLEDIAALPKSQPICKECKKYGIDYHENVLTHYTRCVVYLISQMASNPARPHGGA